MIDTTITKQDHHTSQTKTNPGTGKLAKALHNCLQRRDKIHASQISAVNPDQSHLFAQCLTDLETKTRTKKYPTTRKFQLPKPVTSQT